jgi:hypothetical protein
MYLKTPAGSGLGSWRFGQNRSNTGNPDKEDSRTMSKTIYVACKVSQGLFESEYYITLKDSSAYVDRVNVDVHSYPRNGDAVEGKVRAYLVEEKNDQALVELPGEPVVGGLRAWVPRADVTFMAVA